MVPNSSGILNFTFVVFLPTIQASLARHLHPKSALGSQESTKPLGDALPIAWTP